MSQETMEWLNTMTLIGFTDKRGTAWHYREGSDNHYPDAVPVKDVERRLFNWEAMDADLWFEDQKGKRQSVDGKKIYYRSDTGAPLGIHGVDHNGHSYREWLLTNVSNLLDDTLSIGSAGLLRNGAQAWVSVEVSENVTTPSDVVFRPNLLAVTSFDGSLATTYKRVVTNVVCDNTMSMALAERNSQVWRRKHTRNSRFNAIEAREALAVVVAVEDAFTAEVERLCAQPVSDRVWDRFLDILIPVPEKKEGPRGSAGWTRASNKRDSLRQLWETDDRVVPWKGTAFGVLQAVNTFTHHVSTVKSVSRPERNFERAMRSGSQSIEEHDSKVMDALNAAMATVTV